MSPGGTVSQFAVALWTQLRWLSVGIHVSGVGLKRWSGQHVVQTLCSSGRSWELGVPACLWVTPGLYDKLVSQLSFPFP